MNIWKLLGLDSWDSPASLEAPQKPIKVSQPPPEDARTYVVAAYWPDRKITYHKSLRDVGETIELAHASGATWCESGPEWPNARKDTTP